MSTKAPAEVTPPQPMRRLPHKGLTIVVVLGAFAAIMVPLAVGSIIAELVLPEEASLYFLTAEPPHPAAGVSTPSAATYLNVAVVGVDEAKGLASLNVAGHRACDTACNALRLDLFSLGGVLAKRVGLPPSASVPIAADAQQISTTVELPISGRPSQYPFDAYELKLGVVMHETLPDATDRIVHPDALATPVYLSVQSLTQRLLMLPPVVIDPQTLHLATDPYAFTYVRALEFRRPLYLPVLALLLVVLITAASAYSVSVQSVNQLFVGVGSLVLGVWGVRQILVPGSVSYTTSVELMLSLSILILLLGMIARGVLHWRQHVSRSAVPD